MKLHLSLVLLCLSLALAACASSGTNFDETKSSSIEKGVTTENELVQTFGPPTSSTVSADGTKTLVWAYAHSQANGESFIPFAGSWVGGVHTKSKALSVTLRHNRVTDYAVSHSALETRENQ
jgi:cytoskeletal protein RodZ